MSDWLGRSAALAKDFIAEDAKLLMNRMDKVLTGGLNTSGQLQAKKLPGEKLEAGKRWFERNLRRCVLVSEDHHGLPLGLARGQQLNAISERAGVAGVWMKYVLGPVLSR